MAILIKCENPALLLETIKHSIDNDELHDWTYDRSGDFTFTDPLYMYAAWLRPYVEGEELHLGIIGKEDVALTNEIYGVYHGRFIEMLSTYFDAYFINATATAKRMTIDVFVG